MMSEMFDGAVVMSPSPGFGHADAVLALAGLLRAAAPPGLRVLSAPFPVRLGRQTELRPDLLVARYVDLVRDELTAPPLLAVEVGLAGQRRGRPQPQASGLLTPPGAELLARRPGDAGADRARAGRRRGLPAGGRRGRLRDVPRAAAVRRYGSARSSSSPGCGRADRAAAVARSAPCSCIRGTPRSTTKNGAAGCCGTTSGSSSRPEMVGTSRSSSRPTSCTTGPPPSGCTSPSPTRCGPRWRSGPGRCSRSSTTTRTCPRPGRRRRARRPSLACPRRTTRPRSCPATSR